MFANQLKLLTRIITVSSTRSSHTDIKVPDFSKYMKSSVSDPERKESRDSEDFRKLVPYAISGTLLTACCYGVKSEIFHFIKSMAASADVLALAKIVIDLSQIEEDRHVTFKWRGKPLFVWHRTEESVRAVRAIPIETLRDPQRDEDRVQDPNWLVCLGVCTHLGCVPLAHQGDFGGYYCPCHGSHFDISGRARKGPAPSNLVVPTYTIEGNSLTVG